MPQPTVPSPGRTTTDQPRRTATWPRRAAGALLALALGLPAVEAMTGPAAAAEAGRSAVQTGAPQTRAAHTPAVRPQAGPVAAPLAVPQTTAFTEAQVRMRSLLQTRIADPLIRGKVTGAVLDAQGRLVWGYGSSRAVMPASVTKVLSAVTILDTLGPDRTLSTTVRRGRTTSTRQVVYLVGGGDPSLSSARLDALAAATKATLGPLRGRKVNVIVDDSLFPAPVLPPGWPRSYYPGEIPPVRALVVDRHRVMDTGLDAGKVFAAKLRARGVPTDAIIRAKAPSSAAVLGRTASLPVSRLVGWTLSISDNHYAEMLLRTAARSRGRAATWRNATALTRATLAKYRVPTTGMRLYDASGLSRSDRIPATTLAAALKVAASPAHPRFTSMFAASALPVAGVSGTLGPRYKRYLNPPTSCAKGIVHAKTGSLRDVVSLAGSTTDAEGKPAFFAFVVNGPRSSLAIRTALDKLAATVTGCY